ncbi:hypothetical protein J18TS1_32700 [Oceanobacillus oncorhynchi subsp. incaldanensis]|uniref:DUF1189 domain-containing protein n=1 Tax=Oceanobacillus oncorhynchi TaxID=545501 RepID=A0A0A1MML7_9BACI|nr:DUF1189 family protein [Oceanobacillus oncorhynchi]GIO20170.1 hypothetical protein J18TS1_32700 [Oceanobacillus oncorhynchi subsp. incaldanensis]CEI80321.1 hypothetical protein BN997_00124 [Oceanobacillus oncorhynchi]
MKFTKILKESLFLPQKKAMFQINRIGMDQIMIYLFILFMVTSLPELISRLTSWSGLGGEMNIIFQLIYFFMFYYLILSILLLGVISFIAYLGKGIVRLANRKLYYGTLWKLTACSLTIPMLIFTLFSFIWSIPDWFLFIFFIYPVVLLVRMVFLYPQKRFR